MSDVCNYEEYLRQYGSLTYSCVGTSMLPLLRQGRDLFTVRAKDPEERCQIGDVVLYRRPPTSYVLHRVVGVLPNEYVLLGDNSVCCERGITDGDIIGIMTGFDRGGREHGVDELPYRAYVWLWLHTEALRIMICRGPRAACVSLTRAARGGLRAQKQGTHRA